MDLASAPDLHHGAEVIGQTVGRRSTVRILTADEACDPGFVAEWQVLADHASEPNPFFEPWFLLPSLKAFVPESGRVALLAHHTDGALSGLMPIGHSYDYYGYRIPHRSGWLHANAFYGAPLVTAGAEQAFWEAFLGHMDAHAGLALFLHLPVLDRTGPLNRALEAILSHTGRQSAIVIERQRALHASNLSASDYLAQSLSTKHRKELRRQNRRLNELGHLTVEHRQCNFALHEWITEFLALEAAGWKGNAGSALASDCATRAFFTQTVQGAAKAGKLERLALRLDGKPIAMLASFLTAPGSYSFKTAFDEQFAAHSPGMQLQIENLAVLDRPDIDWTDSCATEGHPMIDRLWTERRHLISRNVAIGGPLRRAAFRQMMAYETRQRSGK